jgi:hypothetical protein
MSIRNVISCPVLQKALKIGCLCLICLVCRMIEKNLEKWIAAT